METINKLYLELSHVATATTGKERNLITKNKIAYQAMCKVMEAIDGHSEWSPDPEVDVDNWNEDAHIEITLTVKDCRQLKAAIEELA